MLLLAYFYAMVAGSMDLLAGWVTLRGWADKIQPRYVIAFAAGVLLSATFFHVLPDLHWDTDASFVAMGFVTFYVLEKVIMIHACGEQECATHRVGPIAVLGMALDNVTDGAGIVAGYQLNPWLGFTITVAVILHEIPQGMSSVFIMRNAGWKPPRILAMLALAGALYPAGALFAQLIPAEFQRKILAFVAGDFIYVGASDLLPEAHQRFNWKVVLFVLIGMACLYALKLLEGSQGAFA
jgi:zinc transporter ZupT